jgi:hypothetical protein
MEGWEPDCFLAWGRVSPKKRWLVQVLSRKKCVWGYDYFGFRSDTGEDLIFTGEFLEVIS